MATSTMTEVQLISAPWCRRCYVIKPDIEKHCALGGATLTVLNYDDLEEEDKTVIKSLPTIRLRLQPNSEWLVYTADMLEAFNTALRNHALTTVDTDF